MIKTFVQMMLVSMLVMAAAPSYSAQATQIWKCEIDDDLTENEVEKMAQDWLKAAKQIEGGEKLEAYVYWPVAVNDTGETDVFFVVVAPSFEEWGKFWDRYPDSEAAQIEARNDKVVCPDSAVWESRRVE